MYPYVSILWGPFFQKNLRHDWLRISQSDRNRHLLFGVNGAKAQEFRQIDVAQQVQGMGRPLNHHPIPGKTIRDVASELGSSRIVPNFLAKSGNEAFFGINSNRQLWFFWKKLTISCVSSTLPSGDLPEIIMGHICGIFIHIYNHLYTFIPSKSFAMIQHDRMNSVVCSSRKCRHLAGKPHIFYTSSHENHVKIMIKTYKYHQIPTVSTYLASFLHFFWPRSTFKTHWNPTKSL